MMELDGLTIVLSLAFLPVAGIIVSWVVLKTLDRELARPPVRKDVQ